VAGGWTAALVQHGDLRQPRQARRYYAAHAAGPAT